MAPKGYRQVHVTFSDNEWAEIVARCAVDCMKFGHMARAAILFRARYGPPKMTNEQILKNNTAIGMPVGIKLEDI